MDQAVWGRERESRRTDCRPSVRMCVRVYVYFWNLCRTGCRPSVCMCVSVYVYLWNIRRTDCRPSVCMCVRVYVYLWNIRRVIVGLVYVRTCVCVLLRTRRSLRRKSCLLVVCMCVRVYMHVWVKGWRSHKTSERPSACCVCMHVCVYVDVSDPEWRSHKHQRGRQPVVYACMYVCMMMFQITDDALLCQHFTLHWRSCKHACIHTYSRTWIIEGYKDAKSKVAMGSWYIPFLGGKTKAPWYWLSSAPLLCFSWKKQQHSVPFLGGKTKAPWYWLSSAPLLCFSWKKQQHSVPFLGGKTKAPWYWLSSAPLWCFKWKKQNCLISTRALVLCKQKNFNWKKQYLISLVICKQKKPAGGYNPLFRTLAVLECQQVARKITRVTIFIYIYIYINIYMYTQMCLNGS